MAKHKKPIDFDSKRLFYSIKEVADHFAVNISLVRFWEKEFPNIKPKKTKGGTRQYTKEDVREIGIVYRLVKEKGLTLEGARQALKTTKRIVSEAVDMAMEMASLVTSFVLPSGFNKASSPVSAP